MAYVVVLGFLGLGTTLLYTLSKNIEAERKNRDETVKKSKNNTDNTDDKVYI